MPINLKEFNKKINAKEKKETILNIYRNNPDKAYTIREIHAITQQKGIKIHLNTLRNQHTHWTKQGLLTKKEQYYNINEGGTKK